MQELKERHLGALAGVDLRARAITPVGAARRCPANGRRCYRGSPLSGSGRPARAIRVRSPTLLVARCAGECCEAYVAQRTRHGCEVRARHGTHTRHLPTSGAADLSGGNQKTVGKPFRSSVTCATELPLAACRAASVSTIGYALSTRWKDGYSRVLPGYSGAGGRKQARLRVELVDVVCGGIDLGDDHGHRCFRGLPCAFRARTDKHARMHGASCGTHTRARAHTQTHKHKQASTYAQAQASTHIRTSTSKHAHTHMHAHQVRRATKLAHVAVQCAACSMQHATCNVPRAECSMHRAACSMQRAACTGVSCDGAAGFTFSAKRE